MRQEQHLPNDQSLVEIGDRLVSRPRRQNNYCDIFSLYLFFLFVLPNQQLMSYHIPDHLLVEARLGHLTHI